MKAIISPITKLAIIFMVAMVCGNLTHDERPFRLGFMRLIGSNLITLFCQESTSLTKVLNVFYFLNGSMIIPGPNYSFRFSNNELVFMITREYEGFYSCGNESTGPLSNERPLIAFPGSNLVPKQPTYYAMEGESTELACGIQPGRLLQQYRATWDVSGMIIYDQQRPPQGTSRFSQNPSNLSLIISRLQLDDTSDQYHCILSVCDPNAANGKETYDYHMNLANHNISLVVLGNFFKIDVQITDDRDTVFIINLGINYNEEFRLSLLYTNLDNSSQTQEVVTSAAFRNATIINHVEFGSQVPFDRFTVRVRLVFPEGMYGPYNDVPGEHDKNQPTVCVVRLGRDIIIVGATLSVVIVILIIMLAVIVIITLACYSRKTVKEGIDNVNHTVWEGMQTIETNIEAGNNDVISAYQEKHTQILEVMKDYRGDIVKMIAEFRSASENRPTLSTQTARIEDDCGLAGLVDPVSAKKQEDLEVLISFVSDSLSAALENPQICNEMKSNVDSVIRRYWKDIETG